MCDNSTWLIIKLLPWQSGGHGCGFSMCLHTCWVTVLGMQGVCVSMKTQLQLRHLTNPTRASQLSSNFEHKVVQNMLLRLMSHPVTGSTWAETLPCTLASYLGQPACDTAQPFSCRPPHHCVLVLKSHQQHLDHLKQQPMVQLFPVLG